MCVSVCVWVSVCVCACVYVFMWGGWVKGRSEAPQPLKFHRAYYIFLFEFNSSKTQKSVPLPELLDLYEKLSYIFTDPFSHTFWYFSWKPLIIPMLDYKLCQKNFEIMQRHNIFPQSFMYWCICYKVLQSTKFVRDEIKKQKDVKKSMQFTKTKSIWCFFYVSVR